MPLPDHSERLRRISGLCLTGLAVIFMTGPLTHVLQRGVVQSPLAIAMRGFAAPVHMVLLISILGIMPLLRGRTLGLIGGALTLMGWTAGVRILALGQLESLLNSGVTGLPADTLRKMFEAAPIVLLSIVHIGILFPIGLITLGVAITVSGAIPRWIGMLMIIGAVLFPVGRIGGLAWAIVSSDITLGATFAAIAWQILARPSSTFGAFSPH